MSALTYRQTGKNKWAVYTVASIANPKPVKAGYVTKTTGLRIIRGPGIITTIFTAFTIRNRKLGTAGTISGALSLIETEISK